MTALLLALALTGQSAAAQFPAPPPPGGFAAPQTADPLPPLPGKGQPPALPPVPPKNTPPTYGTPQQPPAYGTPQQAQYGAPACYGGSCQSPAPRGLGGFLSKIAGRKVVIRKSQNIPGNVAIQGDRKVKIHKSNFADQ